MNQVTLDKYASCMEEIKMRTEVVRSFAEGQSVTPYKQTTAESICLQIRKILELIALSSLVANKEEYSKIREKFHRDYHAKRILNTIEGVNPEFYPVPCRQVLDKTTRKPIQNIALKSGFLTRKEFENIYDRCGGLLHADNPFSQKRDIDNFIKIVPQWMEKIRALLNLHEVQLSTEGLKLFVLMQAESDGKVHVTPHQRVESNA